MRFETEQDLANERAVIEAVCSRRGLKCKKLGDNEIDFIVYGDDNKALFFAEVKCLTTPADRYPMYMLSMIKVEKMIEYSKILDTYLFVRHSDRLSYINIKDMDGRVQMGGRINPREVAANDREMCMFIDVNKLKQI